MLSTTFCREKGGNRPQTQEKRGKCNKTVTETLSM